MTATPSVSVVLTTFNRAEALRATMETLLCQTMPDFELIICDDASSDETSRVAEEYVARDRRVIYLRHERNKGMPGNLNSGISKARGEFVANVHDGDLYASTLLEKWVSALRQSPKVAFVFNQYRALDNDGAEREIYSESLPPVFSGKRLLEEIYFKRWRFDSPVWGTVMARRALYEKAGLFDARFGFLSDVDMWLKLAGENDVAYVSEPLITLPSRHALPRLVKVLQQDAIAHRMFFEARLRHYRGRYLRLSGELARHFCHVASHRSYRILCVAKAAVLGKEIKE